MTNWTELASAFHQGDSALLMATYSRGFPQMLVPVEADSGVHGASDWFLRAIEDATNASDVLIKNLSGDPDAARRHRLQVFPLIPAIQLLPRLSEPVRDTVCEKLHGILDRTQYYQKNSAYTESACDQIRQIIPQVLTSQLISSSDAWRRFYVSDRILNGLMSPLEDDLLAAKYDTALGLSVQFLLYYRLSLQRRFTITPDMRNQIAHINQALKRLDHHPAALRPLQLWRDELEKYTHQMRWRPYTHLMPQTSAAIQVNARSKVPARLLGVCVASNLRALCRSFDLTDRETRIDTVCDFLKKNRITRKVMDDAGLRWLNHDEDTRRNLAIIQHRMFGNS